ncbi:MAG: hypothetical protein JSV66_02685 [Trueperaceae bacterium]|nr:MAG: hypothetical protein JSV66_02685 [Trueperaceae bacterium]
MIRPPFLGIFLSTTLLIPALLSCTGTVEPGTGTSTLLVVTFDAGNTIALVEDTFGTEGASLERLRFVENSERTLPDPAVAIDVVDRAFSRSELFVLSRGPSPSFTAQLSRYDLERIDPGDPSAFALTDEGVVDLSLLLESDPNEDIVNPCLTDLQASRSGRFVALLERQPCTGDDGIIHLVDLEEEELIRSVGPFLPGSNAILPDPGFYLDQDSDTLFFLVAEFGNASLVRLSIPDGSPEIVPTEQEQRFEGTEQVDLGPVGSSLVALSRDEFQALDPDDPQLSPVIETGSGSTELVSDPFLGTSEVLIIGSRSLTAHDDIADDTPDTEDSISPNIVGGTLEPTQGFVYLLANGGIHIFDLLSYQNRSAAQEISDPRFLGFFGVDELVNPGFITWTLAATSVETP